MTREEIRKSIQAVIDKLSLGGSIRETDSGTIVWDMEPVTIGKATFDNMSVYFPGNVCDIGIRQRLLSKGGQRHPHVSDSGYYCWSNSVASEFARNRKWEQCLVAIIVAVTSHNPSDVYHSVQGATPCHVCGKYGNIVQGRSYHFDKASVATHYVWLCDDHAGQCTECSSVVDRTKTINIPERQVSMCSQCAVTFSWCKTCGEIFDLSYSDVKLVFSNEGVECSLCSRLEGLNEWATGIGAYSDVKENEQ